MNEDRPSEGPSTRGLLGRLGQALVGEPEHLERLFDMLRDAHQREHLDEDAVQMIEGVLLVAEIRVDDIMIPRSQMVVVSRDDPPAELIRVALESGHSRFPVVGDSRDEVVGILLAKDLLAIGDGSGFNIRDALRPPVFIPESKRLDALLKDFRASRNHLAIVVDEYGGVAGMVTIEDVLEQIVGDIEDEHDVEEELGIHRIDDTHYTVPALTEIDDFNEQFGSSFTDDEFDTVGGMVISGLGHMPRRGEVYTVGRYAFRVQQADSRRIHTLHLTLLPEASATADTPTSGG
ncbi:MAG: transporter associated domain-containing protein [Gammaproteobacteria bacterium]|nr:transporter associated domain-containing protein [Gammaproteobacteria bacterium]